MAEEQYTHPLYCYKMLLDEQYVQQGAWEGGPVETVGFFDGRLFLRFPNEAAANAVTASEAQDFRLATAEEITAAGLDGLAAYSVTPVE